MPNHPTARALIKAAGCPLLAPSANKSGSPSPTTAAHVLDDFPNIDMVLESLPLDIGIESTVIDATGDNPVILRPGAITEEMISNVVKTSANTLDNDIPRSPGTKYKHYAPKASVTVLSGKTIDVIEKIMQSCDSSNLIFGALLTESTHSMLMQLPLNLIVFNLGSNKTAYAQNLFAHLRTLDKLGVSRIYIEAVSDTDLGAAIMDRLLKAADGDIIHV